MQVQLSNTVSRRKSAWENKDTEKKLEFFKAMQRNGSSKTEMKWRT